MISKISKHIALIEQIDKCNNCRLTSLCQHRCPGLGNLNSKVIFIGEAPGRVENPELRGLPFVGNRSSDLMLDIYEEYFNGYDNVFTTNVVKCNPPNNRTPLPDEIKACSKFLIKELELVKPKLIVCLGRTAANWFGIREALNTAFYREYKWESTLVYATFHPSYILRFGTRVLSSYKNKFRLLKEKVDSI